MDPIVLDQRLRDALNQEDPAAFKVFLESIRREGDDVAVRTAAFLLIDRLRDDQRFPEEIECIKSWLFDRIFEDMRTLLQLTDRWIQSALKIEDFDEMDEAVLYRERFLGTFPKEATMQSFYKAVSLEGKKQYRAALEALDAIPDTLSSAKLASKYFKKAMLQLRINDLAGAMESHQRALVFDPHRQNEIAVLVKADLLASQGKIAEALETFELFFFKTSQKLRYLDRYIDWTVALNRYDDASRFVEIYIPKMLASQSKNYRQQFFEAVKRLADKIHHEAWQTLSVQALRAVDKPSMRDDDCLIDLEGMLRQCSEPFDEHESIRRICMILSRHHRFERLHWIRSDQSNTTLWRFQKDRLYEDSLKQTSLLKQLLDQDDAETVWFPEDLEHHRDYFTDNPFPKQNSPVLFVKRHRDPSDLTLVWVAGISEPQAKESVHRAISLAFSIASTQSIHAYQLRSLKQQLDRNSLWLDAHGIALTTLKNGFLLLENENARRLFSADSPMISFERVFERIRSTKPLFPDDFLRLKNVSVQVLLEDEQTSEYRIEALAETDCIRLSWTPVSSHAPVESEKNKTPGVEEAIRTFGEDATFGWIRFVSGDPFETATIHNRGRIASLCESSLVAAAGSLLVWHRFEQDRTGWWMIKTIDKRVISRIARQANDILRDRLLQECLIGWDGVMLFSSVILRSERTLEAIKDALDLKAFDANSEETCVFVDKKTWERLERSNAMHVRIEEWMKSDRIPLYYRLYANKTAQSIAFAMVCSMDTLDDDTRLFDWTIHRHRLIQEHTQAVWKKAMKEIERFYRETKRRMGFAFVIDETFLTNPSSGRLMTLEAKRRKLPLEMITVIVDIHGSSISRVLRTEIAYLESKGFQIGIRHQGEAFVPFQASLSPQWLLYTQSPMTTIPSGGHRTVVADRIDCPDASVIPTGLPPLALLDLLRKWPAQPETISDSKI